MHLRKTAPQKSEVSFDEPLNTDWDGNELLLSDILGTDEDLVLKPIEDDVDRQLLMDAVDKLTARERTPSRCALARWTGGKDAEGGRRPDGHFAELYLAP